MMQPASAHARSKLWRLVLRMTVSYVVVAALCHVFETELERAIALPVRLGLLATRYRPEMLVVEHGTLHIVVTPMSLPGGPITGERLIRINSSAKTLLVPLVILMTGLAAWPLRSLGERALAICIGAVFLVLIAMLDLPCSVCAAITETLAGRRNAPRDLTAFAWFFLDNGGRQFLSIAATVAAIGGARFLALTRRSTNPLPADA